MIVVNTIIICLVHVAMLTSSLTLCIPHCQIENYLLNNLMLSFSLEHCDTIVIIDTHLAKIQEVIPL